MASENNLKSSTSGSITSGTNAASSPSVAAVGAGRMGRGIAIAFAYAGQPIALIDIKPRSAADLQLLREQAMSEIKASLNGLAQLGAIRIDQVTAIDDRISFLGAEDAAAALASCDLIFEGVPETMSAKRDAFSFISAHALPEAIIASTTSSISVTQLAALITCPERFLNIHWLNPAYLIPIVELSSHAGTTSATINRAKELMEAIGKVPVLCSAAPGYIVPRLQALIMNEAARMIEEGAATAEEIDKATRYGFGLRFAAIGVVEFIDFGGADILHHASREMGESISAERYKAPQVIQTMMDENRLGLKTGSGFYDYSDKDSSQYRHDVLARTLSQLRHSGLWKPAVE